VGGVELLTKSSLFQGLMVITKGAQPTFGAFWVSCLTNIAAMQDEPVVGNA